jgi:hypothetical protein
MEFHHRKIDDTKEYRDIKLQTYNALQSMTMSLCKYPNKIADGYKKVSKVINFGEGDRRWLGYGAFKANDKFSHVFDILKKFATHIVPKDFKYSMITVNRDVSMLKHKDGKNCGKSYIVGLGDYEGGGLVVYDENDKPKLFNIKDNVLSFDGSRYAHESQPHSGRRYTLIFFSQTHRNRKELEEDIKTDVAVDTSKELDAETEALVQLSLKWANIDEACQSLGWNIADVI